ncbi:WXG100 family type VII secretion target [Streptomyces hainanensis]|uniref:WXG100 family type VII secretion target n=1 Tax=Streptomyces hainanensis TaxID=402648 RepID=A0A4R4SHQ7_9ACTN|nr:hypothetical protein [Streptomyces hainanensis]TDC63027.1 hypothetical protein E1283_33075 [Streptomyces hainanensis]
MGDFEDYTHEQLVAMLAGANPEQLTTRADVLLSMAEALNGTDKQIFLRMSQVEWQGEGADAFREWGRHLVEESVSLAAYARTVGNALQDAGQALVEARATMPAVPERPAPLADTALPTVAEELERQEAILVLERLSSNYRTAADDLAAADEPQYRPLHGVVDPDGDKWPESTPQPFGSADSGPWTARQFGNVPSEGERTEASRRGYTGDHVITRDGGEHLTDLAELPTAVTDGQVITSLDSMAPVVDRVLPPGEQGPLLEGPSHVRNGTAESPERMPPHGVPTPLQQRRDGHWGRVPDPGRQNSGAGGGNSETPRSPAGYPQARPGISGLAGPGEAPAQGTGAVRPPVHGGAGLPTHAPSRGVSAPSGVVGGIARPPLAAGRGLPVSVAIGAQDSFAYRDPATGLVRGPGGTPVMKRAGQTGDRPPAQSGRPARSTRKRRGRKNDGERDETQKRND